MAAALARAPGLRGDRGSGAAEILLPRNVRLPVRPRPRRPRPQLHDRRRRGAHEADARVQRAPPVRVGRVRDAGRECRDQEPDAPRDLDAREHCAHEGPVAATRDQLRLGARARHLRPRVLPLEPVAVPEDVRAGARLPQAVGGELVLRLQHRAGERAGGRRRLLALRHRGRDARPDAVVPAHHGLRRRAARRDVQARSVAGQGADDAAQLDRPLARRAGPLRPGRSRRYGRTARGRHRGLHDAHRHDSRRHVRPVGAGAPARRADCGRTARRGGVSRPGGDVPRPRPDGAA